MKITIYEPRRNAKRVKFQVPYKAVAWRSEIKALNGSFFHYEQKLWSLINTKESIAQLKVIVNGAYVVESMQSKPIMPKVQLSEDQEQIIADVKQKLILKAYSHHTVYNYSHALANFVVFFQQENIADLTNAQIESYLHHLITKY